MIAKTIEQKLIFVGYSPEENQAIIKSLIEKKHEEISQFVRTECDYYSSVEN